MFLFAGFLFVCLVLETLPSPLQEENELLFPKTRVTEIKLGKYLMLSLPSAGFKLNLSISVMHLMHLL